MALYFLRILLPSFCLLSLVGHPTLAQTPPSVSENQIVQNELDWLMRQLNRPLLSASERKKLQDELDRLKKQIEQLTAQGRFQEINALYQRALELQKTIGLGNLQSDLASQAQAEAKPFFEVEPEIFKEQHRRETLESIQNHRSPRKVALLQEADKLAKQAFYFYDKDQYDKAIPLMERALKMKESIGIETGRSEDFRALGFLYEAQGRYEEAESMYKRAIDRDKRFGRLHAVALKFRDLALLHMNRGDSTGAVEALAQHLEMIESILGNGLSNSVSEDQMQWTMKFNAVLNVRSPKFFDAVTDFDTSVSLHLQSATSSTEAARLALTTIFRRKGRILDTLTNTFSRLRQRLNPSDQRLLDQLGHIRTQLANLAFQSQIGPSSTQYQQMQKELQRQAEQIEKDLTQRNKAFRLENQVVDIAAVQKRIPTDAVLVEFLRYRPFIRKAKPKQQWGTSRYAAYILTANGKIDWVDLGEADSIDTTIATFRQKIRQSRDDSNAHYEIARQLNRLVMEPILARIGNVKHLLLSPDGDLNLIPFEALVSNNQYLIERYLISYLTSGRDLLRFKDLPSSQSEPFVFANINYDSVEQRISSGKPDNCNDTEQFLGLATDLKSLGRASLLLCTQAEANLIKQTFQNANIILEQQASETALKRIQSPSLLHLATHGFFLKANKAPSRASQLTLESYLANQDSLSSLEENPLLRSGLALAGFNHPEQTLKLTSNDGVLTAFELSSINLYGTQLVVLSACETGLGEPSVGEGVYGLRRSLVLAGSRSQVLSLWKVDSASTSRLMRDYYKNLSNGQGKHEALRNAQLAMLKLENSSLSSPYHWAGFIASGDWGKLQLGTMLPATRSSQSN